jgi:hypothetical protein
LAVTNHGSALKFPAEVDNYFSQEINFGAMLGPFPDPPFPDLHCSPLMTAPKDGDKRRIIVDLSFSSGQTHSVNSTVSKFVYNGTPFSLKLPTVEIICQALNIVGKNVKIFQVDLARAFRQLHVDPFDIKFLGLFWRGAYYVDVSVPFGYRNGTHACLRVTDAIRFILWQSGIFVFNYIDDIVGIAPDSVADVHFKFTLNLLNKLGFYINNSKTVPPTSVATCLGIVFNLDLGVISIPLVKLQEVIALCTKFLNKKQISKKQLQALIGSLIYLHKAISPARMFVNRILALLRNMGEATAIAIDEGTKQDLQWFIACAHGVNGSAKIFRWRQSSYHIYVDASLKGLGGVLQNFVYKLSLPHQPGWSIAHWEAINILVALRVFSSFIKGHKVVIWCDNKAAVSLFSSGRGIDPLLHSIARNLWLQQAVLDCELVFQHIRGADNKIADLLSRWDSHINPTAQLFFLLNGIPVWCNTDHSVLNIDLSI